MILFFVLEVVRDPTGCTRSWSGVRWKGKKRSEIDTVRNKEFLQ